MDAALATTLFLPAVVTAPQGEGPSLPHRRSAFVSSSFKPQLQSITNLAQFLRQKNLTEPTRPAAAAAASSAQGAVVLVADVTTAVEVEFTWRGSGNEVLLTGDFLNWDTKLPLSRLAEGTFGAKQKLSPGRYSYKFIVDGVWQHSQHHPTVSDGAGGFNNVLVVEGLSSTVAPATGADGTAAPAQASSTPETAAAGDKATPPAGKAGPPAGKAAPAGKAGGKKAAAKPIGAAMEEDILPPLRETLSQEPGIQNLSLKFDDNELRGSFLKNGIPYDFWAYFPDGDLNGSRGFSLTSCGNSPSTVEPFIIDERRITPELVVFWVTKRLFAQKLLSLN